MLTHHLPQLDHDFDCGAVRDLSLFLVHVLSPSHDLVDLDLYLVPDPSLNSKYHNIQ